MIQCSRGYTIVPYQKRSTPLIVCEENGRWNMTLVCWPEESEYKRVYLALQYNSADSTQQPSDSGSDTLQRQSQTGDGKAVTLRQTVAYKSIELQLRGVFWRLYCCSLCSYCYCWPVQLATLFCDDAPVAAEQWHLSYIVRQPLKVLRRQCSSDAVLTFTRFQMPPHTLPTQQLAQRRRNVCRGV